MQSTTSGSEILSAKLILAAAILSFLVALSSFVSFIVRKLKKVEDKQRAFWLTVDFGTFLFPLAGAIAMIAFKAGGLAVSLLAIGTGLICLKYVATSTPAPRNETLILVLYCSGLVGMIALYAVTLVAKQIGQIAEQIGKIIDILSKLVH